MIIDKYNKRAKEINSLLCVGLDSDFEKISEKFKQNHTPQFEFNKWIIEQTHEYAAAFKLNIAFYEARGDKGNTNEGYVISLFDWLGFDAVTVNPYLGQEAVQPFLDRKDKGSIILCRTSNPGAGELQDQLVDLAGRQVSLWEVIAERVSKIWNKNNNCMLVVGATYPEEMKKIREITGGMTFLVPGVGAQGGSVEAIVKAGLNSAGLGLIINSSRGIIFSADPKAEAQKLCEEIRKYK